MVGGNLPGVTRTVSIDIYDRAQSLDYGGRQPHSIATFVDLLRHSVGGIWNQPECGAARGAAMGGQVSGQTLAAQVRKTHFGDGNQSFLLDVVIEVPPASPSFLAHLARVNRRCWIASRG